jgi:hypothetical protein
MPLELLGLLVLAENLDSPEIQVDGAEGIPGLGWAEAGTIVLATPLLADVHDTSIQIEIAPAKTQQFLAPHACLGGCSVEGEVRLISHGGQRAGKVPQVSTP